MTTFPIKVLNLLFLIHYGTKDQAFKILLCHQDLLYKLLPYSFPIRAKENKIFSSNYTGKVILSKQLQAMIWEHLCLIFIPLCQNVFSFFMSAPSGKVKSHVKAFYQFLSTVASIPLRKRLKFLVPCYPSLHQEALTTNVLSWLLLLVELQSVRNCKKGGGFFLFVCFEEEKKKSPTKIHHKTYSRQIFSYSYNV